MTSKPYQLFYWPIPGRAEAARVALSLANLDWEDVSMNRELFATMKSNGDLPWGMVFPKADALARHPSQLYQFALEGVLLFALLWWFSSTPRRRGQVTGLFLVGYGIARFAVEFVREPDAHLGFIWANWMTMGQLLTLPMIAVGLWLLMLRKGSLDARLS